jgi:DtxR family Mn-dependent transcriptional regulator
VEERVLIEDALKHIHECEYRGQAATAESLAGALAVELAAAGQVMADLERCGLVAWHGHVRQLTREGRKYARQVLRAHRLYETYLARQTGLGPRDWHGRAERQEHALSAGDLSALAHSLGNPRFDPHGDPIPTADGDLPPVNGRLLPAFSVGADARIMHIEDEPPDAYRELAEMALTPGLRFRVIARSDQQTTCNVEGRLLAISAAAAGLVQAQPLADDDAFDDSVMRLAQLRPGETAVVAGLLPGCVGQERSRLLDLGIVPGTRVRINLVSPFGDPVAYIVRGAAIALRNSQANNVLMHREPEPA